MVERDAQRRRPVRPRLISSNFSLLRYSVVFEAEDFGASLNIANYKKLSEVCIEKTFLLSFLESSVREFLKTPNQMLIFLFVSIFDTVRIPKPVILQYRTTYLACYVLLLFCAITTAFIFKIWVVGRNMETDRLYERLR